MLLYLLEDKKLYLAEKDFLNKIVLGPEMIDSSLLFYLNEEIYFQGKNNNPTLRDIRTLIMRYKEVLEKYYSLEDFIKTTKNMGFVSKNNKKSKYLYLFKVNRIEKNEAVVSNIEINNNSIFSKEVYKEKYKRKRNIKISSFLNIFNQHSEVDFKEKEIESELIDNYNGLGLSKLDYLMDLCCKDIFDTPILIKEYLYESYIDVKENDSGEINLLPPVECIEEVEDLTLTLHELISIILSTIQIEIMIEEDYLDLELEEEDYNRLYQEEEELDINSLLKENNNIICFPNINNKKDDKDA